MDGSSLRASFTRHWPSLLVVAMALGVAGWAYGQFWPDARYLWWSPTHDRNAHYWMAQCVGLDLRNGDLVHLARDIERMRIWGPTFPLITGVVLALGGADYRLAALTSMAAWVGAAFFAFLVAKRVAPRGGDFAGAIAAVLIMASPAFHAFATDIMLEGPGACLSLIVVHAYLRARQQPSRAAYRWFAVAMTALFLLKCNYWLLALFALVATEACRWIGLLVGGRGSCRAEQDGSAEFSPSPIRTLGSIDRGFVRSWCIAQLRHPLNWLLLIPLGLLILFAVRGPFTLPFGLRIRSADTLADVAYWIAFLRLFMAWLRLGRSWLCERSTWAVTIADWHLWPTAAWFLLPKRIGLFVWYLTRNHGPGEGDGFVGRIVAYAQALATDYVPGVAILVLVVVLTAVTFLLARRLRPGAAFLLWFIVVSAGLTALQSTCRSRFLHSWIAATWVTAGVGAALCVVGGQPGAISGVRRWAGGLTLTALLMVAAPAALGPGHAFEGGPDAQHRCVLRVADELLPQLDGARRVAILSTHSLRFFVSWTYQERRGRTERIIGEEYQLPADPAAFAPWADRAECDAVVWIDAAPDSLLYFPSLHAEDGRVPALLAHQACFAVADRCDWPELHCSAVIWRRAASLASRGTKATQTPQGP
jgi:hypothetical protein